jgi:methylmalonyl-CoA mutase C-terminal domain/subunit
MRKTRVLIAKLGLDGHDLGAKWVARGLREAGMEVIYTGRHQTPQQIASAALQEDVDVIGLSFLSGAHLGLSEKLMEELKKLGLNDKRVIVGGVIPKKDIPPLKNMGVHGVFPLGCQMEEIVKAIQGISDQG